MGLPTLVVKTFLLPFSLEDDDDDDDELSLDFFITIQRNRLRRVRAACPGSKKNVRNDAN